MAINLDIGRVGETMAVAWLEQNDFTIIDRNWRHWRDEIDIIATKENVLHFIEVKTRKNASFGYPEESVTKKKFRGLKRAVDEYLYQHPGQERIQYDILAITLATENGPEYFLLNDVFL